MGPLPGVQDGLRIVNGRPETALSFRMAPAFDCQGKHFQKQTPRGGSERGRALVGDGEGALEGDADAAECAFLEEAAD